MLILKWNYDMGKFKYIIAIALLALSFLSHASSWYYLSTVGNEIASWFFDADSVELNNDHRLIWIKIVRHKNPDSDGAWATASRYKIYCKDKKYQTISNVDYDINNNYLKTYSRESLIQIPAPESNAEGLIKVVCRSGFPDSKSGSKFYLRIEDNDIYRAAKAINELIYSSKDLAPK
jgi:hypothetical protein